MENKSILRIYKMFNQIINQESQQFHSQYQVIIILGSNQIFRLVVQAVLIKVLLNNSLLYQINSNIEKFNAFQRERQMVQMEVL